MTIMGGGGLQLNQLLEWPTILEMCRRLGISLGYGYQLVWRGKIRAHKIGGEWRVCPDAIQERLARKQQGATNAHK